MDGVPRSVQAGRANAVVFTSATPGFWSLGGLHRLWAKLDTLDTLRWASQANFQGQVLLLPYLWPTCLHLQPAWWVRLSSVPTWKPKRASLHLGVLLCVNNPFFLMKQFLFTKTKQNKPPAFLFTKPSAPQYDQNPRVF